MKITTALFVAALLAVPSLYADWEIVQKANAAGKDNQITIKIKDDKIRNDVGDTMTMLIDTTKGSVETFIHANKMMMKMDSAMLQSVGAMAGKMAGDATPTKPKATGEKVKVGEWDTEVYTWENKLGSGKFYVAKDFPHFAELSAQMDKSSKAMSNPMTALFPKNSDFPGMVVKSELTMMGQKTSSELVSAVEKTLPAEDFKAPEGYQEMKVPGLPGGLGK